MVTEKKKTQHRPGAPRVSAFENVAAMVTALFQHPHTVNELADVCGFSRSTVQRYLYEFEEHGVLVVTEYKSTEEHDVGLKLARAYQFKLPPRGRCAKDAARPPVLTGAEKTRRYRESKQQLEVLSKLHSIGAGNA